MDFAEALSLGALIAAYTRQGFDINIALSAIGLYWKLADYTLITAREAQPGDRARDRAEDAAGDHHHHRPDLHGQCGQK